MLGRLVKSLRTKGIAWSVDRGLSAVEERLFDLRYGTDTVTFAKAESLTIEGPHRDDGTGYQPSRIRPFRRLMSALRPPAGSAFVDFGCGKGRLLLLAADYGFQRITGVEFAKELANIASDNLARYQRKKSIRGDIRIIQEDAVDYRIQDDDNFFFMFNPFAASLVEQIARNVAQSVTRASRQVFIIYSNPLWRGGIEQQGFSWVQAFDSDEILVYSNSHFSSARNVG
jgi:predicted RNA methylase